MGPNLVIEMQNTDPSLDYQILNFKGEFDKAGFSEIKEKLDKVVDEFSKKTLIFDLTELKYINSEGIGYFMSIHTHFITRGRGLVIVGAKENIKDIFNAIGIGEIVKIYSDLNEFINNK